MAIIRCRKKPVEVQAVQWNGGNVDEVRAFVGDSLELYYPTPDPLLIFPIIHTLEGDMNVSEGDYIIKGVEGEFYPCKADIFDKTYECLGAFEFYSIRANVS